MTLLITGSNGFLGGALVKRLLARGERGFRCMVRSGSDRRRLDEAHREYGADAFDIVEGSLSSIDQAAKVLDGVTQVHHLAAALSGAAADMFLNTVVTSKNMLEAAKRMPKPPEMILISSFSVYGVSELGRGALVDEKTPLEPHPEKRDLYAQAKLRQEQLFWEYRERDGVPLCVLRPGVIYGPGGSALSTRVGLRLPGIYLYMGGSNLLPLNYVDNSAESIAVIAKHPGREGEIYNVVDDDLLTCGQYLARYRREVEPLRAVPVPFFASLALSHAVERYHAWSKGQLPAILTPYKFKATWNGNRFDNQKLRATGWRPIVSTDEGVTRTFEYLRSKAS